MATAPKLVVFDSSGLVSLLSVDDDLHSQARAVAGELEGRAWRALLPYEILAETLNVIGKKLGRATAVNAGQVIFDLYTSQGIDFIHANPHILRRAIELQAKATGSPSFIDALVMAYADAHGTEFIFGFDATFAKNGYRLPPVKHEARRAA